MDTYHAEIIGVAVVVFSALLGGALMVRLRQPAIIGYILAGVILGPEGFGIIANRDIVGALAEFGVLLLLFVVGIELDLRRFVQGWKVAVFATLIQILFSVGIAMLLARVFGWSVGMALVIGFVVSVSSTAVVIKILESSRSLHSHAGRMALGILIAQDMAVVPMMILIGGMNTGDGSEGLSWSAPIAMVTSIIFLVLLFWLLLKNRIRLPFSERVARHPELGPLLALAWCFGAASLAGSMGLSAAYGAFLAGIVIGNSSEREHIIPQVLPTQTVLLMVFFLSIGLLVDFGFIYNHIWELLILLLVVTLFKTLLNVGVLRLLGENWHSAFVVSVLLAQVGEFSLVLAQVGQSEKIITGDQMLLIVSVTVLSLAFSPVWQLTMRRAHLLASHPYGGLRPLLHDLYGGEAEALRKTWTEGQRLWSRFRRFGRKKTGTTDSSADVKSLISPREED